MAAVVYFMTGYFGLNLFNEHRSYYVDVSLPLEAHLPFVPEAAFPYGLVFPTVVLGCLSIPVRDIALFRRGALLLVGNMTLAFLLFLALPVRAMYRPEVVPGGGWARDLAAFWFYVDRPTNLFPSLHVNVSLVAALLGWRHSRAIGAIAFALASAVAISTVLLHQHYLADIAAAALMAFGSYWMTLGREGAATAVWRRLTSA
jgi:membrane-associated phospholipid phosphatase